MSAVDRLVVRKSLVLSGAIGKLGLALFAPIAIVTALVKGAWPSLRIERRNPDVYFVLFLLAASPVLVYAFYRDLTTRLVLTDEGLSASGGVGFGRFRLGRGMTPVMPWKAVRRVRPMTHLVKERPNRLADEVERLKGVAVEGEIDG